MKNTPVLKWKNRKVTETDPDPVFVRHLVCGDPITPTFDCATCGRSVTPEELSSPGPYSAWQPR